MIDHSSIDEDRSFLLRYGSVVLLVLTAYEIGLVIAQHFVSAAASLFICSIILSSWLGGAGAGFLAVALALVLFKFSFVSPVHTLAIAPTDMPRMILFSSTTLFVASVGALQNRTSRSLARAHAELQHTAAMLRRTNDALAIDNAGHEIVEAKLRLSEAFLAEGQRISHTGTWRWNIDAQTLTWSDEHFRIFDCAPQPGDFPFRVISGRFHSEDLVILRHVVGRALREQSSFECEYRIVLDDGEVRYMFGAGRPNLSKEGAVLEYIGTTVDITARKRAENLLRESENAFRTLAENLPDNVVRYNADCERIYVNPAFERDRHVKAADVLHRPIHIGWTCKESPEDFKALLGQVFATGEPATVRHTQTLRDGSRTFSLIKLVAERGPDGTIVSALAIGRDVTEAVESANRIEESRRVIQQLADRSENVRELERKRLARDLHDDIAQSLLALRLQVNVIGLEFSKATPRLQERVDSIVVLVDESIAAVRNAIEALRPAALDIGAVAGLEWLAAQYMSETKSVCKVVTNERALAVPEKQTVTIFRIAQEALRNVARHARAKFVLIEFNLFDGRYELGIIDDGDGFDPSVLKERSFGLVGIRERAEMCDGTCTIDSAPGQGTVLCVSLPAGPITEPA